MLGMAILLIGLIMLTIVSAAQGAWSLALGFSILPLVALGFGWYTRRQHEGLEAPLPKSWLKHRVTDVVPAFRTPIRAGNEILTFSSREETWRNLGGYAGYALVREGEIIDILISVLN